MLLLLITCAVPAVALDLSRATGLILPGFRDVDAKAKEFGITVQTGGRNELFNVIFDHDVFNAWRPGTQAELGEDPRNSVYVCVPQLAVPGNIKPHQGVWQDLSVPAIERRFPQIVLERREHERLGLPPKAWTFGWTLHDFDIHPPEALRERSRFTAESSLS